MAKTDRTFRAVDKVVDRVLKGREFFDVAVPIGPSHMEMTPTEARRKLKNVRGETLAKLMGELGPDLIQKIVADSREDD